MYMCGDILESSCAYTCTECFGGTWGATRMPTHTHKLQIYHLKVAMWQTFATLQDKV